MGRFANHVQDQSPEIDAGTPSLTAFGAPRFAKGA
jgi:hypothetical protein